jgi:hypothetical protein
VTRYACALCGLLLWFGVIAAAWADDQRLCDDAVLDRLGRQYAIADLRHPIDENDAGPGSVVAEDCRVWPHKDAIQLAAIAYSRSAADVPVGERELGLIVAMLDRASGRLVAGTTDSISEDAVTLLMEGTLRIDTARYDLAPNVRAFGMSIRSMARGASCPDGIFNDELRLFVRDGDRLRQVASVFQDDWQQISGSMCNSEEASVMESARVSIGVEKTRSHGYADLRLIANVERSEMPAASQGGEGRTTIRRETRVIRYDGKQYQPDGYGALYFWSSDE